MTRRSLQRLASCALLVAACGCLGESDHSYLRFEVDGKAYTVKKVTCRALPLPVKDMHRVIVGGDAAEGGEAEAVPRGGFQWRTRLYEVNDLENRQVDILALDEKASIDLVLDQTGGRLTPGTGAVFEVKVTSVDGGYLGGIFTGRGFLLSSGKDGPGRAVEVTGRFRAKILDVPKPAVKKTK